MKNSRLIKFVLSFLIITLLGSCTTRAEEENNQKPLYVSYKLWWGDYTLLVAKKKGLFDKYGVNVEPVYYPIFSESLPDLAAGQIDASLMAVGDVMNVNRYAEIQVVAISDDGSYVPIVARPEYIAPRGLKGKTIGVLIGSQYEILVSDMLASAALQPNDVILTELNPEDVVEALKSDRVQAAFTWEPYTSQALAAGNNVIYPISKDQRLFPDTIAFRKATIEKRPEDIRNFLKAWFEAVDYRNQNPEETRQIAAEFLGISAEEIQIDPSLKVLTLADNLSIFQRDKSGSIFELAQRTGSYMLSKGILTELPSFTEMLDPGFLP